VRKKRRTTADALGIPLEELSDEVKARLLQTHQGVALGPNSPLRKAETFDEKKAARSQAARKRGKAGEGFEAELEIVHGIYLLQRRAKMERIRPNTVWKKGEKGWELRLAPGGAPLDFVGTIAGGLSTVLDAKVCDNATYTHLPEQYHQLDRLAEHHQMGAAAFLLVKCPSLEIAYLIGDPSAWRWLRDGKGIMLRGKLEDRDPRLAGTKEGFVHEWPYCARPSDLLTMQTTPQWDWLSIVEQHFTLGRHP
jgi:hypothetical protein